MHDRGAAERDKNSKREGGGKGRGGGQWRGVGVGRKLSYRCRLLSATEGFQPATLNRPLTKFS